MANRGVPADLQLEHNPRLQHWEWLFERAGWLALLVVVGLALAGFLGNGPLSKSIATSADGNLRVEYDKYLHYRAPDTLTIQVDKSLLKEGEFKLRLGGDYLRKLHIEQIMPRPLRELAESDAQALIFEAASADEPVRIIIHFQVESPGTLEGTITAGSDQTVTLNQFVYP